MKKEKEEGETSGGETESKKKETNGKEMVNVNKFLLSEHWVTQKLNV